MEKLWRRNRSCRLWFNCYESWYSKLSFFHAISFNWLIFFFPSSKLLENNNAYEYFLGRLALEHFNFGKNFAPFLDLSFKDWEVESEKPTDYEWELIKKHSVPNEMVPSRDISDFFEKSIKQHGKGHKSIVCKRFQNDLGNKNSIWLFY